MAETKAAAKKAAPKKKSAAEIADEVVKSKKWVQKNRIYKLRGKHAKSPWVQMQAEDRPGKANKRLLYFDEEKGRQRAIRFIVNFDSPFIDEQDNSGWSLAQEQIVFEFGVLMVDAQEVSLQKFLEVHPWNEKNGGKGPIQFYEYDPEAEAKKEVDYMMIEAKAIAGALDADLATSEAILRPVVGSALHSMKTDRLTRELLVYAKKEPVKFLEALDDDKLKFKNAAYTAIDFNICYLGDNGTTLRWKANNEKIVAIPFGSDPYEFIGEWFTTNEGLEVMNVITQKLKKQ